MKKSSNALEEIRKRSQALKKKKQAEKTKAIEQIQSETTRPLDIIKQIKNLNFQRENLSLSVLPTSYETYDKQIQCELESKSIQVHTMRKKSEDQIDLLRPKEKNKKEEKQSNELNIKPIKSLNKQELDSLLKSKHFSDFFNQSTKLLEKVLDNGDGQMLELFLQDDMKAGDKKSKDILTQSVKFFDQHYTTNRVVTSLDWSPQIPDLVLASYSQNEEGNIKDHVGVLLLWSLNLRTRPEFYCFCQSMITSACFYPYSNNTILGGCYNGQLLLWDIRTKSLPVQRTGLSSPGHKYPVYSLNVVGTQIANNIISISNDGKLCIWDIKSFSNPSKVIKLQNKSAINVTCCEFPQGDVNNFYFGAQNGVVHKSSLHHTQSSQDRLNFYEGHNGPITGVSVNNPSSEYQALSGLVLSSSFDWSVKLWSAKQKQCLRTFEYSDDYIHDVDWNPSNPGLFSSVNNEGYVDLWDLTTDMEMPIIHTKVNRNAINKCKWNRDGSKLMTGDSEGIVSVFDLQKKYRRIEGGRIEDLENLLIEAKQA